MALQVYFSTYGFLNKTERTIEEKKSGPYEDRTHDLRVISTAL